jgi:phosphodiesterase/alkaline phosphatase D-like protein
MGIGAVLLAAAGVAHPFTLGVTAGEVRPTSVQLWAHATPGAVSVDVGSSRTFRGVVLRRNAVAPRTRDGTVHVAIVGLRPATRYYYRFRRGRRTSATGRFTTAPRATSNTSIRFASSMLTVTPKDTTGRIVNDITGQPCTPVVIRAR